MKYLLIPFLFILSACKESPIANQQKLNKDTLQNKVIYTSRYVILKLESFKGVDTISYPFSKKDKTIDLSFNDIEKIETLIAKRATEYNKSEIEFWQKVNEKSKAKNHSDEIAFTDTIRQPEKYFKQLIAVKNEKGEREVYVNCFCAREEKSYWRKNMVEVSDGGACFFQVYINLTKGTITKFYVNGVA